MKTPTQNALQNELRARLVRGIVRNILLICLSVLILCFPQFVGRSVAVVLGWVLVAIGGIIILVTIWKWKMMGFGQLLLGLALAGFGIYILLVDGALGTIFAIAVGIYMIVTGLLQALQGFRPRNFGGNWIIGVLGLIGIGLGVTLILVPKTAVEVVMMITGIALLVSNGLSVALNIYLLSKLNALEVPTAVTVIDAEE